MIKLSFIFAALIVITDQFFKRWVILTLSAGGEFIVIPGVLRLVYAENFGAAFGIFANMRWPLAGVMFVAVVILVAVIKRYSGGFWGTLGLAAVLGGGVGNLIDRVWHGFVVDMFDPLFVNFAIFNIADIFITLGAITFFFHFVITSGKVEKEKKAAEADNESAADDPQGVYNAYEDPEMRDILSDTAPLDLSQESGVLPDTTLVEFEIQEPRNAEALLDDILKKDSDSVAEGISLTETKILEEYDLDKLLKEYGLEDDKD